MRQFFLTVPWLKPFLEWAFAILIVLIVLATPAYFLLLPTARRFRSGMAAVLQRLHEEHENNRTERRARFEAYLNHFTLDRLLRHVNLSLHRFWFHTKSLISDRTERVRDALDQSRASFEKFNRMLPRLQDGFSTEIESALPERIEVPRMTQELLTGTGNLSLARWVFGISLFVIIALILVNTGMLGQIIKDVFLPPTIQVAGMPLYVFVACFLTFFETALGFGFSALLDPELSRHRAAFPIGAIAVAALAIFIGIVEGSFYSRTAIRTDTVIIPITGVTVAQSSLMFIYGFSIVFGLFMLGHICFKMGAIAKRGSAMTALRKQVKNMNHQLDKWTERLNHAEAALKKVRQAVRDNNEAATLPGPYAKLEGVVVDLNNLAKTSPEWTKITQEPLDISAVNQIAHHALAWLIVTIAVAAVAVFTGYASFGFLADRVLLTAVAQCCIFIIGGMLVAWHETVEDGESQKVMAPTWARLAGFSLIGLSVIGYLVAFIHYGHSPLIWFANILVLAAVAAATYQLMPLVGLLPIWGHRLLILVARALEFALRVIVGIIFVVAVILEEIVSIVAKPLDLILNRRTQPQRAFAASGESK